MTESATYLDLVHDLLKRATESGENIGVVGSNGVAITATWITVAQLEELAAQKKASSSVKATSFGVIRDPQIKAPGVPSSEPWDKNPLLDGLTNDAVSEMVDELVSERKRALAGEAGITDRIVLDSKDSRFPSILLYLP